MRKINIFVWAMCCLMFVGCGSDDASEVTNNDQVINSAEEQELSATTVSSNLTIANATKITGNPPAPNGSLDFTVTNTTQSAFLNSGFDLRIPRTAAGAYLQIKGSDGTLASEYYNIANNGSFTTNKHGLIGKSNTATLKDGETNNIEVDFGAAIAPGRFCYVICIYDTEGNISQPQEVCVEVEAWGGNTNLVGTWQFVKSEFSYPGQDELDITIVGQENCDGTTLFCENEAQEVIEGAYCDTIKFLTLVLNADGTYRYDSESTDRNLDFTLSAENCEAIYQETEENTEYSIGNWAYDEEENKFTLVEFQYFYSDESDEVQIEEDGYLVFDGTLTLSANAFSLFEESLNYRGETETGKIEFEK